VPYTCDAELAACIEKYVLLEMRDKVHNTRWQVPCDCNSPGSPNSQSLACTIISILEKCGLNEITVSELFVELAQVKEILTPES
jgi:hypothetical protein